MWVSNTRERSVRGQQSELVCVGSWVWMEDVTSLSEEDAMRLKGRPWVDMEGQNYRQEAGVCWWFAGNLAVSIYCK